MTSPAVLNLLLFAVLPYVALVLFLLGTIRRYRSAPFTYSSLSSQFLENKQHFWGSVGFHYGLLVVLLSHLIVLLIPRHVLWWDRVTLRLYLTEILELGFALLALIGLASLLYRRFTLSKMRRVTSPADWVILTLLVVQIAAGVYISVIYPWGSLWYAAVAAPYLRSLFTLQPNISFLATLPFAVKLHIVNAWLIVAVFPYTRLVHALVAPVPYWWRKPEVVRWYGIRMGAARPPVPVAMLTDISTTKSSAAGSRG